mmetsp:Transcript_45300/g.125705  ORF Transcript_45300/g.125705 Transcript_45300/m.125705 type:complete len:210 (+) Transcript_45300:310-939(+)
MSSSTRHRSVILQLVWRSHSASSRTDRACRRRVSLRPWTGPRLGPRLLTFRRAGSALLEPARARAEVPRLAAREARARSHRGRKAAAAAALAALVAPVAPVARAVVLRRQAEAAAAVITFRVQEVAASVNLAPVLHRQASAAVITSRDSAPLATFLVPADSDLGWINKASELPTLALATPALPSVAGGRLRSTSTAGTTKLDFANYENG